MYYGVTPESLALIIADALVDKGFIEVKNIRNVASILTEKMNRYRVDAGPLDDEMSTHCGSGNANFDTRYNAQYIQNETTTNDVGDDKESIFHPLEHIPILEGTLNGTIYRRVKKPIVAMTSDKELVKTNGLVVQHFVVDANGTFAFTDVKEPTIKVVHADIDMENGVLKLIWNEPPGPNFCVVSYECQPLS